MTGKMGLSRSLTSAEIVAQVYHGIATTRAHNMPPLTNIVYMGMGDAGKNIANVTESVRILTDQHKFQFSNRKITVSTVGPDLNAFEEFSKLKCSIAWSLHSPDVELRHKLIPTSRKYTPIQLRDALVGSLVRNRPIAKRTLMIAVTLIDGVNDSLLDAQKVAEFIKPMLVEVRLLCCCSG